MKTTKKQSRGTNFKNTAVGETAGNDTLHEIAEFKRVHSYDTLNIEEYKKKLNNLNVIDLCAEGVRHEVKVSSATERPRIIALLCKKFQEDLCRFQAAKAAKDWSRDKLKVSESQRLAAVTRELNGWLA